VPVTDEKFGKLYPCPYCGAKKLLQERRYNRFLERIDAYGIRPVADQTFDSLVLKGRPDSLRAAQSAARRFVAERGLWLTLYGDVGAGKTHLAMAVANALQAHHEIVMFAEAPGLLDLLRSGYDRGDYDDLMQICKTVDYLLIDDVGTEQLTPWAQEKLFQIINYRYRQRPPLSLLLTMNATPDYLGPRLLSRLSDHHARIIRVTGSDYRRQQ